MMRMIFQFALARRARINLLVLMMPLLGVSTSMAQAGEVRNNQKFDAQLNACDERDTCDPIKKFTGHFSGAQLGQNTLYFKASLLYSLTGTKLPTQDSLESSWLEIFFQP